MNLRAIYVRFYRAFNFDYLRKQHPKATPNDWDIMDDGAFYPYIHLDIDSELTAIVGANESGKSQLLQAVEYALGIGNPTPGDFCRYSDFFTVAEAMRIRRAAGHCSDHLRRVPGQGAQARLPGGRRPQPRAPRPQGDLRPPGLRPGHLHGSPPPRRQVVRRAVSAWRQGEAEGCSACNLTAGLVLPHTTTLPCNGRRPD